VAVDGQYGPQTERAVRHWQRANRLTVDGIIGPQTLASLDMSEATASGPVPVALAPGPAVDPEGIIRDVWPDDLEDRAVAIATRESRLQPGARNACCYGLFQIHWQAHRAWLAEFGVTSPAGLLDARTNATVALALYQAAGWGPWAL
jgi:peptidoglycan hydrolase-like protein with peptidoglycan-binding domain